MGASMAVSAKESAMTTVTVIPSTTVKLHWPLSDDQFAELCRLNPDLRFEYTSMGDLLIMPPTGGDTGETNAALTADFVIWARKSQAGSVFDSSTGFMLPNGAKRSPDVSWVQRERWDALSPEERRGFVPLCPDFVLELRSPSDSLQSLRDKMAEYMENGARLGWLVDPLTRTVYVYRPGHEVERLDHPETLSGEAVLPGFMLSLAEVW
jgi:Uma2 family endonuclease